MIKQELISSLTQIHADLKDTLRVVERCRGQILRSTEAKTKSSRISLMWFDLVTPLLPAFGIQQEVIDWFSQKFSRLYLLSNSDDSTRISFLTCLKSLRSHLPRNVLAGVVSFNVRNSIVLKLIEINGYSNDNEEPYFNDAIGCARIGLNRGTLIMSWCGVIERLYSVVEHVGFDDFSRVSSDISRDNRGRFRHFSNAVVVQSRNDLTAKVTDHSLLWILEGLELIDKNQHERLSHCLTLRNSSAHPNLTRISDDNVIGYLSDIRQHVFENSNFDIAN